MIMFLWTEALKRSNEDWLFPHQHKMTSNDKIDVIIIARRQRSKSTKTIHSH